MSAARSRVRIPAIVTPAAEPGNPRILGAQAVPQMVAVLFVLSERPSSRSGSGSPGDSLSSAPMSTADTKAQIETAILNFQREVPALVKLKLVFELELRGRGDIQLFRVEVPGPKITKDIASDAKVRLSVPRSHFNELAAEGKIRHWREGFESGVVKATGPPEILKLIASVVAKQESRSASRKLRAR